MPFDDEIRTAIESRRLLEFDYKQRRRIVEPHDLGIQRGHARLLAYQIAGDSSSTLPAWRWFDLAGIEHLTIAERTFAGSRGDAHHRHHHWDVLIARVR